MFGKMQALLPVTALLLFLFQLPNSISADGVPRPRGVSLAKASLYHPRDDQSWVCLDGSKVVRFVQINDDYCDCADGSDEPGTAACAQGRFHCANLGYRPQELPASRVNDGVCDCCDTSDEYAAASGAATTCTNTCQELGRAEQKQRRSEAELHKRGAARREEMVTRGRQMRAEREVRRVELESRRREQEALRVEKETLKHAAEALETEALEVYKEQQRELDAATAKPEQAQEEEGEEPMDIRAEAEASFVRYDKNNDGFVEFTELQVDMTLDRDRNGVVTVEEAKYFLDERERIDMEAFVTLSWPRIKPIQMLALGLFKPPQVVEEEEAELLNEEKVPEPVFEEQDAATGEEEQQQQQPNQGNREDIEDEEEEYEEDDGDADVGVGSVTSDEGEAANTPAPEYDPETQRLVELANAARNAHDEVDRTIREIEHEIKEIDDQTAKDYGASEEFATMDGECYKFEDREYLYSLCPFDRAAQKQRSGGAETTLGRWDQWQEEGGNRYARQKYAHGAACWNGPQRSAIVQLRCALEHRITAVSEPNRCEYFFEFETPAACDNAVYGADAAAAAEEERLHDEL